MELTFQKPPPDYMKDNVNNYFGSAPDRGSMKGPVLAPLNSTQLHNMHTKIQSRSNTDDYWLSTMGSEGQVSTHHLLLLFLTQALGLDALVVSYTA
jgi:hypothetical protein